MTSIAIAPRDVTSSFRCSKCDLAFPSFSELVEHKSTHMTMRQTTSFRGVLYECDICGKGYVLKSSLTRHKKKHLLDRMQQSRDLGTRAMDKENEAPQRDLIAEIQQRKSSTFQTSAHGTTDQRRKQMISLLQPLSDVENRGGSGKMSVISGRDVQMGGYHKDSAHQPHDLSVKAGSPRRLGAAADDLFPRGGGALYPDRYSSADDFDSALDLSMKTSSFNYDSSFDSSFVKTECDNNSSYIDLPSDTPLDLSLDSALLHRRDTYPCDMNTSLPESEIHRLANETIEQYKCKVCPATFSDRYEMLQHSKTHRTNECTESSAVRSDTERCTCMFCGEVFHSRSKFSKHIRTHYKEQTHYCQFCCIMFLDKTSFQEHCKTHLNNTNYKCNVCRTDFRDKREHVQHLKCHQGDVEAKPYLCGVCYKDFPVKSYLDSHMRVHIENRPFKCPECGKGFSHNFNLTKHLRIHSGEKPYECHICHVTFGQKNSLNRHLITHLAVDRHFQCRICSQKFYSHNLLLEHMIQGHDKVNVSEEVNKCGTGATADEMPTVLDLKDERSMKMGQAGQPSVDMRGEPLKLKVELDTEQKYEREDMWDGDADSSDKIDKWREQNGMTSNVRHLSPGITESDDSADYSNDSTADNAGVRREIFPELSEQLSGQTDNAGTNDGVNDVMSADDNSLERELRQKINNIPIPGNPAEGYICPECGKVFKTKNYVRSHLKTHMDVKPYACKICHKSFSHSFNLTKHIRCHTGEQPYSCDICDRRFSHVNSLNRHALLHRMQDFRSGADDQQIASAFECPVCRQAFDNIKELEGHILTAHESSESNMSDSSGESIN